jgi:AraC-like DNA-binding protein
MNNLNANNIDWSSSEMLMQFVKEIKAPLDSIIEANQKLSKGKIVTTQDNTRDIIFSSSQQIASLIEKVVERASSDATTENLPLIYQIYYSNERVQSMCKQEINPNKISKQDAKWLMELESEVYKNIKHKDLNLYDLSYKLAVSERQLHRKIKSLLHLTPNKYIRILRLHKAKQFIDDYIYDTISQISYAVGYYDTHYFSKLFNQQYGVFPKELLKARRL